MSLTHNRARVAALSRSRSADDPDLVEARRSLAEEKLAALITQAVESAPPLTVEQRSRLATLLGGGGANDAA